MFEVNVKNLMKGREGKGREGKKEDQLGFGVLIRNETSVFLNIRELPKNLSPFFTCVLSN